MISTNRTALTKGYSHPEALPTEVPAEQNLSTLANTLMGQLTDAVDKALRIDDRLLLHPAMAGEADKADPSPSILSVLQDCIEKAKLLHLTLDSTCRKVGV